MNEHLADQLDRALAYQGDGLPTLGEIHVRTKSGPTFELRYATRARAQEAHAKASGRLEGGARTLTIDDDYGAVITVPVTELVAVDLCRDYRALIAGFVHPGIWASKVEAFFLHITQGDPAQLREVANHPSAGEVGSLLRRLAKEEEARREAELMAQRADQEAAELGEAVAEEMAGSDFGEAEEPAAPRHHGWNPFGGLRRDRGAEG